MPTKCNFWRLLRSQSMKRRGRPWGSGFEEVLPPSSLDSNRKDKFLCGVYERNINRSPPQQDAASDHLHLEGNDQPTQGGLQEGLQLVQVEAGGVRRCWGLFIQPNVKFLWKGISMRSLITLSSSGFSAIVFVNFKKQASISLAPCTCQS